MLFMSPWGSALECDMLLLQDMTASGQWTGLPQLCWATKKRTCVQYLDPATVNPDLVPQRRFILVGQTPVHAVAVHSWSEQTLHCTRNFPMQGDGQRSIEGLSFPCGRVMGIQIRLHVLLPLVAILAALSPVLASHPWQSVLLALLVAGPLLVITAPYPGSLARNCHVMPFQTNGSCFSCPESFFKGEEGYWKRVKCVVISSWSMSFEWSMLFRSWSTNWATSSQRNAVVAQRITSCYGPWGALPLLETVVWSPRTSPDIAMARKNTLITLWRYVLTKMELLKYMYITYFPLLYFNEMLLIAPE